LAPRLLEYSGNNLHTVQRSFALTLVPTVVQFANALALLYRALQALKEGVEYLAVRGNLHHHHHHGSSGEGEFEAYVRSDLGVSATGDGFGVMLGVVCVLGAMAVTVYSAATHDNHKGLWMLRLNTPHTVCTPLQNVLVNPYNRTTLFVGLCVLSLMTLTSPSKHPMAEPLACIAVALLAIFVAVPTCNVLGRTLLLAASSRDAAGMSATVARVATIPGVVRCAQYHVWRAAQDTATVVALRVEIDQSVGLAAQNALRDQINSVLGSSGMKSWTVDLRSAAAPSSDLVREKSGPGLEVIKFTFYVFMPMGFMVYFGGPGFYERYVADETYKFNAPPKTNVPTEPEKITKTLEALKEAREQRRLAREQYMKNANSQSPGIAGSANTE
ncbi:hypothetical protein IW150_006368, partial [Coemansia sp. RSA 2607]